MYNNPVVMQRAQDEESFTIPVLHTMRIYLLQTHTVSQRKSRRQSTGMHENVGTSVVLTQGSCIARTGPSA